MLCASSFSNTIMFQGDLMLVLHELHIAVKYHITSRLNGLYFSMLLTTYSFCTSASWHSWSKHSVVLWLHKTWTLL